MKKRGRRRRKKRNGRRQRVATCVPNAPTAAYCAAPAARFPPPYISTRQAALQPSASGCPFAANPRWRQPTGAGQRGNIPAVPSNGRRRRGRHRHSVETASAVLHFLLTAATGRTTRLLHAALRRELIGGGVFAATDGAGGDG